MKKQESIANKIKNWNKQNVHELKDMIKNLSNLCEQNEEKIDAYIKIDSLPTKPFGKLIGHEDYPVWAIDQNRNCLVGQNLDSIESEMEILSFLN